LLLLPALCCSDSGPSLAPCQLTGSATLTFRNESSSATLIVFVDNHYVADVAPRQTQQRDTPGGSHTVDWFFKGTHVPVCGPTTASVAPCESAVFSCGSQPAPCELSHTGLLVLRNGMDWFTYDVYVDGTPVARLTPQQQADNWVSADVTHDVEFRGTFPCSKSAAVAACEQLLVSCP
jgi:hypothetical protein